MNEDLKMQAGSWVGELKKLPTWGKIAVGAAGIAVVVFAIYEFRKGKSANSAAAGSTIAPDVASMSGATQSSSLGTVPISSSGTVPIVPPGYVPVYDPQGNLIGWQMPGPTTTPAPPVPPAPGTNLPNGIFYHGMGAPNMPKLSTYTVTRGDSLPGIAARLSYPGGAPALHLANVGVIGVNPNSLQPGQVLHL